MCGFTSDLEGSNCEEVDDRIQVTIRTGVLCVSAEEVQGAEIEGSWRRDLQYFAALVTLMNL